MSGPPPVEAGGSSGGDGPPFERLTGADGLTYQPGLDGLRGLAVAAVVGFHLGSGHLGSGHRRSGVVTGGYLGVSLFFTLSGVLIGTLILHEIVSTGRFSLRAFWLRRARRLLPPALVTLAVIAWARLLIASLHATSSADVVASALDVANWHFLVQGSSYSDLFVGPSAVLHFWSLAIEEQFYVAVGLFAVLVAARATRPVRTVGLVATVVAGCSFLTPLVAGFSVDRVYYGTDTRAGELMIGVAMAAVIASPARRRVLLGRPRTVGGLAAAALASTVGLWCTATPGSEALRRGLLPLTAVLSVLVITGALLPTGPVAAISQLAPLRWLGRISYAVYLIHWPVIVVANHVTADRSVVRSAVLVAISLGLAQLSAVFVERPVRRAGRLRPLAAAGALALVSIGVASAFEGRTSESADLLDRLAHQEGSTDGSVPLGRTETTLPHVALFGDSVGFSMLLALGNATVEPAFVRVASDVNLGCGIALSPEPPGDQPHLCDHPAERFFLKAVAGDVTAAVMISCQWELIAQPLPDDEGGSGGAVRTLGDPEFDGFVAAGYAHVADRLADAGVDRILWMTCPYLSQTVGVDGLSPSFRASRRPERIDRLNAIITDLAADREDVTVLPFADWVNERIDDVTIRPDGSHYEYRSPNPAADAFITLVNEALEKS